MKDYKEYLTDSRNVVVLKLKTGENILVVDRGQGNYEDPIFTSISYYPDGGFDISIMRYTRFTMDRVFNFKDDAIGCVFTPSETVKEMYAKMRVFVYDVDYVNETFDTYMKNYGDALLKTVGNLEEKQKQAANTSNPIPSDPDARDKYFQELLDSVPDKTDKPN